MAEMNSPGDTATPLNRS